MKTIKEIKERIEDIHNAMVDCDNHANYTDSYTLEIKKEALKWVIE